MQTLTPPYVAECEEMDSMEDTNMASLHSVSPNMASLPSCVEEENENQYQDLKPWQSYDEEMCETQAWRKKHPDAWAHGEVMAWLLHLATELPERMDMAHLHLEAFQGVTGREMAGWGSGEFTGLEPQYGAFIHEQFQELLKKSQYNAPAGMDITYQYSTHTELSNLALLTCDDLDVIPDDLLFGSDLGMNRLLSCSDPESGYATDGSSGGDIYSESVSSSSEFRTSLNGSLNSPKGTTTGTPLPSMSTFLSITSSDNNNSEHFPDLNIPSVVDSHIFSPADSTTPEPTPKSPINKVAKRGRPRKNPDDPTQYKAKTHRGRKQASKGSHLWEFVRDLLLDDTHNPSIIKWEDRADGVFRFVKSEQVARMWGQRKNNSTMTYEKLSRAMRHYYKNRILLPVLGRRLVYKFGPGAKGWRLLDPDVPFRVKTECDELQKHHDCALASARFEDYHHHHHHHHHDHQEYHHDQPLHQSEQLYNRQYHQLQDSAYMEGGCNYPADCSAYPSYHGNQYPNTASIDEPVGRYGVDEATDQQLQELKWTDDLLACF